MHVILRILKFGILRVPPIQGLTKNGKMQVLFSEFHHRTNLTSFLLSNLGSEKKLHTPNFEIRGP
jgi:hypothetical protein